MASSQTDDLFASIHNPENTSQTLPSQQQNQFRRPKTNSAFEATVLDQLESMNKNFEKIFKRMENFEARFNAIDESLEDQFQRELHLPRWAWIARRESCAGNHPKGRAANLRHATGLAEVRVVEEIEKLCAKLYAQAFG